MKKYILTISAVMSALTLFAQSEDDALMFSQTYQQGTARSAAMGGAFGALGGDLSVLATNPAGMSIYKDGEFSFTPVFSNTSTNNTLNGFESTDDKFSFKFSNIGFVLSTHNGSEDGFSGFAIGMTYNHLYDLGANNIVNGRNDNSSMIDLWTNRSQGVTVDDLNGFSDYLAWDCYLMDTIGGGQYIYKNVHQRNGSYGEYQKYVSSTKGGINTWDFAMSGVFAEKLYFGASLGIQSVNFKKTSTYSEDDKNDVVDYEYWDFKENQKTKGCGANLKVGVIYKPVNFLRFGAAIHTPTFYQLTDKYYSSMSSCFDEDVDVNGNNNHNFSSISTDNDYEYRLLTPLKAILSGAFIVPNYGLISVDYEYVDYTKCKFESNEYDNYDFEYENKAIKDKFKATKNLRFGAEYLVGPVSVRAGYAMYGNPYKFVTKDIQRQIISGGIGYKGESFYFDLTGTYHIYQSDKYLYEGSNPQTYSCDNNSLYIITTFGFKF
ncbi:MAG: hypothetical protein MJ211_01720 [Bacteroidales bacterium]|nr:hypothetical protein [Bacteroidales bacterium]